MQETVQFSVLVPVYNAAKYLDECILSVLNQTYHNYEIILVDDGSTDESGWICDGYASRYSCIYSFHKKNAGQLHTREYAVNHANGEYCVFLDADDYLELNALEKIYEYINVYKCDCLIYGIQRVSNGNVVGYMKDTISSPLVFENKREWLMRMFLDASYNSMCRKAIKTDLFPKNNYNKYYHLRHGEDLLQSIDVLYNANCVVFAPDVLYNYRLNLESVSQSVCYENYENDSSIRNYVANFMCSTNFFNKEDIYRYRAYAIRLFINEIEQIAGFSTRYDNKKKMFHDMINDSYYQRFLDTNEYDQKQVGKKHFFFVLFRKRCFRLICFVEWALNVVRRIIY